MRDEGSALPSARDAGPPIVERGLDDALRLIRERAQNRTPESITGERAVVCRRCAGHITFTGGLAAIRCPYCLAPIERDDVGDAPPRLPVDGVVPFAIDAPQAQQLAEQWVSRRWFSPNGFKTYARNGSLQSLYATYFAYHADTCTRYEGERGDEYTIDDADGEPRTGVRWRKVSGTVENNFDDITVFANTGLDARRVAEVGPWPVEAAKPYAADHVASHLCRPYDRAVDECFEEASTAITTEIRATIDADIGGDRQRVHTIDVDWKLMEFRHLLVPIWLLTVIHLQRPYQVYINGVTGQVEGVRPYSKPKLAAAIVAALVLVATAIVALAVGGT